MKKYILSLALSVALFKINAQQTQSRTITPFTMIQVSGIANVHYTESDSISLAVTADEADLINVETKIEGSTLVISTKGKFNQFATVHVKSNGLTQIITNGASSFKTINTLKADSIDLNVAGSSGVNINVQAKKISTNQSGASSLILNGNTNKLDAIVSGASTLKAYNLVSNNANIISNGASSAKVYVTDKLNANASGASSIKIKGEVKDVNAESTSAASITKVVDNSQQTSNGDTTTFKWKSKKMIIIGDKNKKKQAYHNSVDFDHWAGFALGINGLLTPDAGFAMAKPYGYLDLNYSRCINVQLNFIQRNLHIYKNYINLVTGFGIEWRRYMLENKTTLDADSSFTWGVVDSTNSFKFSKNLLASTMLQVPLLLDINISKNPKKAFHISVGVIGQFMINSKTKQIFERDNNEYTKINKDSYNMNPLSVKAHASIGYSNFTVFGEYNLTPLFKSGAGPQLSAFVGGVRLLAF